MYLPTIRMEFAPRVRFRALMVMPVPIQSAGRRNPLTKTTNTSNPTGANGGSTVDTILKPI